MKKQTFIHRFPNGIKATAILNSDPPQFSVQWSERPNESIMAEYFAWREGILDEFTKRTGKRILVVTI